MAPDSIHGFTGLAGIYRQQAERARRLAEEVNTAQTADGLRAFALKLEDKAEALEKPAAPKPADPMPQTRVIWIFLPNERD